MRKILVLRGGALGDFIVTLPALAALRRHFPTARLELAGNAPAAQLAVARGLLDAAHSQHESRWSALYGAAPLPADFAAFLSAFDLVVNFWPDPDRELAARFPLHPAQTFLTAPALPTLAPAAAHYAAPLATLGITNVPTFQPLHPLDHSVALRVSAETAPRQGITLHPGSGSPKKNWPRENWLALLPHLPPPITLVLGEAEQSAWSDFTASNITLLRSPPLETLIAHFSRARLFLGHDSGISHLAAACVTPSLLLFGPTDPKMWAPSAPHVQVLHSPNLATLPVSEVLLRLRPLP